MPQPKTPLHLVTLGRLALVDAEGTTLLSTESGKLLALLSYLAARPGRLATRDHLIDLFWADSPLDKGRNSLRQAIYRLRATLGDALRSGEGQGDIGLSGDLTTDRDVFLGALELGDFESALRLYTGPFAPGLVSAGSAAFERWADNERERLHDLFAAAAETVAQRLIADGDARRARPLAQRLLDIDPLDERAWRLRLEAEMASGSRVLAAASVAELQRVLGEDHRQPEPRTAELIDRVIRAMPTTDGGERSLVLVADLVGREHEFHDLYQAWRTAMNRRAVHVVLCAEAGVGKTRLLDDFAFRLEAERARVARIRATPRQRGVTGSALATIVSVLAAVRGATGISDPSARILAELQPAIAARFPNSPPVAVDDAGERRRLRTEAFVDLLSALTDEGPVCLLFDDTHWWDGYSREIVANAIERMAERALLVVTASRPGPGEVATSTTGKMITLRPLDRDQIVALLMSLGDGCDPTAIPRLADGLQVATGGVPLLVIEAVRLGLDRNLLRVAQGRWDFSRLDEFVASLRPGVVLAERIAALTPVQRELLLLAAVLESPIDQSAADAEDSNYKISTIVELESLGMLAARGNGWVVAHDAIAQVTIETATHEAIRRAHGSAARLLAPTARSRAQVAVVIHHYMDASDCAQVAESFAEWVQRCRESGDDRSGAVIVQELLGPDADEGLVAEAIRALPRSLRYRPAWPRLALPVVAVIAVAGFLAPSPLHWSKTEDPGPDATIGIFTGPPEHAVQFAVPLHANSWDHGRGGLVLSPASNVSGGFPGRVLNLSGAPMPAPDGRSWLVARPVSGDLGPTELSLVDITGTEHVIASGRGDDVNPDWSPDGRFAVFSTTRWSSPGDATFDLAIVDVASGEVRRLTDTQDSDEMPRWSPDGTRIAFIRKPARLTPDELCWVTPDGNRRECRSMPEGINGLGGWTDARDVMIKLRAGRDDLLAALAIDGSEIVPIITGQLSAPALSPNGEWVLCDCATPEAPKAPAQLMVFPVRRPEAHRQIEGIARSEWLTPFWDAGPHRPWLASLRIVNPGDSIAIDASYRMSTAGIASDSSRLDAADAVMTWRSGDTSIATIDHRTAALHPKRRGATWIYASAGGWRSDSLRIVIGGPAATIVVHEAWSDSWRDRWVLFGPDPLPTVAVSRAVGRGLTPNGNGTYFDGGYSRRSFSSDAGLGVEGIVQAPINRSKWQMIDLGLRKIDTLAKSLLTAVGCGARLPLGEGWSGLHFIGSPDGPIHVADSLAEGKPFRLRIQIFPDGSCGVAIDGRPVSRRPGVTPVDQPLRVVVMGQSVRTVMMVGALSVWRGVRGDVDWSTFNRDTTAAAPRGRKPNS